MVFKTENAETGLLSNAIITYRLIKELKWFPQTGLRLTYGIQGTDADGHLRVHLSDISTYRGIVATLVDRCNAGMVSQVHIIDILEDYLNGL